MAGQKANFRTIKAVDLRATFERVDNLTEGKAKADDIADGDIVIIERANGYTVRRQHHEPPPPPKTKP